VECNIGVDDTRNIVNDSIKRQRKLQLQLRLLLLLLLLRIIRSVTLAMAV
jgi:hypothetical protein